MKGMVIKMIDLNGKKVFVVGTGISGIGSAGLLEANGAIPVLYDGNTKVTVEQVMEKLPTLKEMAVGEKRKELRLPKDKME